MPGSLVAKKGLLVAGVLAENLSHRVSPLDSLAVLVQSKGVLEPRKK